MKAVAIVFLFVFARGVLDPARAEDKTPGFYERKAEGWFWYAVEAEESAPEEEERPAIPLAATQTPSAPFSAAWLRVNLPKYLDLAWNEPSVENLRAFLYLQRFAIDRAEQFSGAKTNPLTILPGNQIGLSDLIAGGEVKLYSCAGDRENCLNAGNERKTVSVTGIRERIDAMLLGDAATPGIVEKYASNSGALNDRERAFVSALPDGVGAIVRNLSLLSRDSASLFVLQSSGTIALAMTHDFIEELFRAAESALVNSDSPYKKEALQGFERSRRQVRGEHAVLSSRYGTLAELIGHYDELVDNTRKKQYRSSDAPQDESDSGKE